MTSIDVIRDCKWEEWGGGESIYLSIYRTRLAASIISRRESKKWFNWFTCSAGTRFSLPPPFPHFLPFDSLCTHLSCPAAIWNRPQDAWKKTLSTNNSLSRFPFQAYTFITCGSWIQEPMKSNFIKNTKLNFLFLPLLPVKSSFSIRPEASLTSSGPSIKNFWIPDNNTQHFLNQTSISGLKLYNPCR